MDAQAPKQISCLGNNETLAGASICFASDWPVSPIDPLIGIEAAVTRKPWAESDPDQSFSLEEALSAYCMEGAYAEFKEDRIGRIRAGYLADIVMLDGDIESVAPDALHGLGVQRAICGGRVTFSADEKKLRFIRNRLLIGKRCGHLAQSRKGGGTAA